MRLVLAASISMGLVTAAAAAEPAPSLDCALIARKLDQVTRLAQTCSDAAYLRSNVEEADAACASVFPASKAIWPTPDADTRFAKACPAQSAAFERHLVGLSWALNWNKWRADGSGKTPTPLRIEIPTGS